MIRLADVKAFRTLLLAALLGLAGCSTAPPGGTTFPSPAAAAQPASTAFGGTDLAWIEINIAMDEQVLPLLNLVPTRSGDPDVQALALQVKAFTEAELSMLRQLHIEAGLPAANPYKETTMPGMVTTEQVTKAAEMSGVAFDQIAVQQIKAHLEEGQNLARSEDKSGVEPQTRGLALQVLRTRQHALSTLQKAL
jgi:uncharacterized protein (DUF305 family)